MERILPAQTKKAERTLSREAEDELLDPRRRMELFFTVIDKNRQRVPWRENPVQARINADPNPLKMILKPRQVGASTNEILVSFDSVCWVPDFRAGIIADEDDSIKRLFNIVRRTYELMDPRVRPELDRGGGSLYEYRFPAHNSSIFCDLEIRSEPVQRLHVSEAAYAKPDRILESLEAVPKGCPITIESVANGMANHFYEWWFDKYPEYSRHFYPWFFTPEYTLDLPEGGLGELADDEVELINRAWIRWKLRITPGQIAWRRVKASSDKFRQFYPEDEASAFIASGASVMDQVLLSSLVLEAQRRMPKAEGHVMIYKPYRKDRLYVIGADPAEGITDGDGCAASVFDALDYEQVATIHGQWKPERFAELLVELAGHYRISGRPWPMIAVERNNHGHAVLLKLAILRYPAIFRAKDDKAGWLSNTVTRPVMIDVFIDGVESRRVTINDPETLREGMTLVDNDGKIEAGSGKHDDRVVSAAIGIQLCMDAARLGVYDGIEGKILVG